MMKNTQNSAMKFTVTLTRLHRIATPGVARPVIWSSRNPVRNSNLCSVMRYLGWSGFVCDTGATQVTVRRTAIAAGITEVHAVLAVAAILRAIISSSVHLRGGCQVTLKVNGFTGLPQSKSRMKDLASSGRSYQMPLILA